MTGGQHDPGQGAARSDLAFRVGDRCDQYEVVELIAVGGSGEVYRAVQPSIDRHIALKCLQFRLTAKSDLKARMQMEGRALGQVNHPNVVTVYDAGCTGEGVVWIAMELLVGRTLREMLLERGELPVAEAVDIALDVAQGVGAAHAKRIIHRDIKPENVFVTEQGIVKVLDLGTAKLQGWGSLKTTDRGRVLGTPAYMAPEHMRCAGVDERTDVYAVGLLLHEMVAGHPFAHVACLNDHQEVAKCQLYVHPRPLAELVGGVPEGLSKVVLRALEKDPADRQQSMGELVAELRLVMGLPAAVARLSVRPPAGAQTLAPRESGPSVGPHGTAPISPDACSTGTPPVSWSVAPGKDNETTERCASPADSPATRGRASNPSSAPTELSSVSAEPEPNAPRRAQPLPVWSRAQYLVPIGAAIGLCVAGLVLWGTRARPLQRALETDASVVSASASALTPGTAPVASSAAAPAESTVTAASADGSGAEPHPEGLEDAAAPPPPLAPPHRAQPVRSAARDPDYDENRPVIGGPDPDPRAHTHAGSDAGGKRTGGYVPTEPVF